MKQIQGFFILSVLFLISYYSNTSKFVQMVAAFHFDSEQEYEKESAIESLEKANAQCLSDRTTNCQVLYYQLDSAVYYLRNALRYLRSINTENGEQGLYNIQQNNHDENHQQGTSNNIQQKRRSILIVHITIVVILSITLFHHYRYIQKRLHEEQEWFKLIEQLSVTQKEKIKNIQKLEVYLKDRRNLSALNDLEQQFFAGQDHWKVMLELIEMVYPGSYDRINKDYPSISELEKKVLLLSPFKLSRTDEAALLGISTSVLDKVRGKIRKLKSLDYDEKSLDG